MNKQKGLSLIVVLLAVAAVLGLCYFIFTTFGKDLIDQYFGTSSSKEIEVKKTTDRNYVEEVKEVKDEFKVIDEDETTPEEINNKSVEELDQLINSIETGEELSDIEAEIDNY